MTETVLITGGTGFIGSYLGAQLVEEGHDVVAFDASADRGLLDRLGVATDVRIREGDVTDLASVANAIRETNATRIVHLAAYLGDDSGPNPRRTTRVNVVGTTNVLEAARLYPEQVTRVVVTSSETVYGPGSAYDGTSVPEDALLSPDGPYSASKRYGECLADTYREEYGVSTVALRPTGVFGPFRESFTDFAALFEAPALGDPVSVAGGGTAVSWLYVKDAADAFARATLADEAELSQRVYNVRGQVATVAEAAEAVRDAIAGAEVTVTDDQDHDWSAQALSLDAIRSDLGYDVAYDLPALVREYADAVREAQGTDPR